MRSLSIGSPLLSIIRQGASRLSPGDSTFFTMVPELCVLNAIAPRAFREAMTHQCVLDVTVSEFPYQGTSVVFRVRTTFLILDGKGREHQLIEYSLALGSQLSPIQYCCRAGKGYAERLYRVWTLPRIMQPALKRKPEPLSAGSQASLFPA